MPVDYREESLVSVLVQLDGFPLQLLDGIQRFISIMGDLLFLQFGDIFLNV